MMLVAVVVIAVAGFAVYRLNGIFGSHDVTSTASGNDNEIVPFNPKHVVIEVYGAPGTIATITYLDVDAQPQRVDDTTLPWSYDTTTTQPAVFVNVSGPGRRRLDRLPDHDRRRRQGRENGQHLERLHLLPGQVRMTAPQLRPRSAHGADRRDATRLSRIAHTIRVLCVPIVIFWVLVAALTQRARPPARGGRRTAQRGAELSGLAVAAGVQAASARSSRSSTPTARR